MYPFGLQEIPLLGHVVSSSSLKLDPSKIKAVLKMELPIDKAGVERLRGTVSYLSNFVPKLYDVMHLISNLDLGHKLLCWRTSTQQRKELYPIQCVA